MSIPPGLSGPLPVPDFFTRQFPAGIVIGSVFFGALSIVVILFAVVFARHKNKTRALWAMLGIIGVIYACSIVDYAFQTHVFLSMLHGRRICFANLCATIVNISTAINQIILVISVTYVILLINDCVVVWRAWTLWRRSKLVLVTSGVLILANITLSITSLVLFHKKPLLSTSQTGTELPIDFVLVFAISIAINFYTTVLVGIRTWQYWRAIRGTAGSLPLLFKLLLIIVESGFIYLILWTVFLCSLFPSTGPLFNFNFYLNCGVPYVAAMYPAAIFILVGIHKSAQDEIFTGTMLDSLSVPSGHAFSAPTWTVGPAMSTGQEGEMQLSVLSEPAPSSTSSSQNKIERGSVV